MIIILIRNIINKISDKRVGSVSAQYDNPHPDNAAHKRDIIPIQQKETRSFAFAFAFALAFVKTTFVTTLFCMQSMSRLLSDRARKLFCLKY